MAEVIRAEKLTKFYGEALAPWLFARSYVAT
jgi:hypothetical protein